MALQGFLSKNLHLIISTLVVIPAALLYGWNPDNTLPVFLDIAIFTTDLRSILRAVMFLYLGFTLLWILGMFKNDFWKTATIVQFTFMGALALGRVMSILTDGLPSEVFTYGLAGEAILAFFGFYQYRKHLKVII